MIKSAVIFTKKWSPLILVLVISTVFFFLFQSTTYGNPIADSQLVTHLVVSGLTGIIASFAIGMTLLMNAI